MSEEALPHVRVTLQTIYDKQLDNEKLLVLSQYYKYLATLARSAQSEARRLTHIVGLTGALGAVLQFQP